MRHNHINSDALAEASRQYDEDIEIMKSENDEIGLMCIQDDAKNYLYNAYADMLADQTDLFFEKNIDFPNQWVPDGK